jgi:methyltransferase (TIGR00027 family)
VESGRASVTARAVAAARLHAAREPWAGGRPEDDERLARDVAGELISRASMLKGHLEARTAFVDRVLVHALADGVRQVVLAGAGYDGRALRYARDGVRWFELDHLATQADKRERLARLGIATDGISFVAADFRTDPVAERLLAAGCDAAERSVVVCEGVAVYLETGVLERLLTELGRATGPGSALVLTASTAASDARAEQRRTWLRAAVASVGEPMRSSLSADDADAVMRRAGWEPTRGEDASARDRGFLLAVRHP